MSTKQGQAQTSSFVTCHASPVGRTPTSKNIVGYVDSDKQLLTRHRSSMRTRIAPSWPNLADAGSMAPATVRARRGQYVTALLPDGLSDPGTDGLSRLSAPILSFPEDTTNIQGTGSHLPAPRSEPGVQVFRTGLPRTDRSRVDGIAIPTLSSGVGSGVETMIGR